MQVQSRGIPKIQKFATPTLPFFSLSDLAEETFVPVPPPQKDEILPPEPVELPKDESLKEVYNHLREEYDRQRKEQKEQEDKYQRYRDKVQQGFYMLKLCFGESENRLVFEAEKQPTSIYEALTSYERIYSSCESSIGISVLIEQPSDYIKDIRQKSSILPINRIISFMHVIQSILSHSFGKSMHQILDKDVYVSGHRLSSFYTDMTSMRLYYTPIGRRIAVTSTLQYYFFLCSLNYNILYRVCELSTG